MAMRTLKNLGHPVLQRTDRPPTLSARSPDGRESRGPETSPSLERDGDPHGRVPAERGKNFDKELVR